MNTFWHWGQLGDIVYSLPTIRALGGGRLIIATRGERFEFIAPLLRAQSYIESVESDPRGRMEDWGYTPPGVTHDLNTYRLTATEEDMCRTHIATLAGRTFGLEIDPRVRWLERHPDWECGRSQITVVARSPRYHHPRGRAAWAVLLGSLEGAACVGLPEEAADLGVPHRPVRDALELAKVIYEGLVFVGNQSFPLAVAIGLGVVHVVETRPDVTNTIMKDCPWQKLLI